MIVTPFGDLNLEDDIALRRWDDAHARRHAVYVVLLKMSGGQELRGFIDGDWMLRHWARHVAIAQAAQINLGVSQAEMALPGKWRTESEMHDWHDLHNRLHLRIDQQLGVV